MQDGAPSGHPPLHDVSSPLQPRNLDGEMSDLLGASPGFAARMGQSPRTAGLTPPDDPMAVPAQHLAGGNPSQVPALDPTQAQELHTFRADLIQREISQLQALREQRLPETSLPPPGLDQHGRPTSSRPTLHFGSAHPLAFAGGNPS